MYRILTNSLKNYIESFSDNDARLEVVAPLRLLLDIDVYFQQKADCSEEYKQLSELLFIISSDDFLGKRYSSLLWTLESRGIIPVQFNVLNDDAFQELIKVLDMIKNLAYWKDSVAEEVSEY